MTRNAIAITILAALSLSAVAEAQVIRTRPATATQLIRDGDVVEVFVDERGKIYREMRYQGIIPDLRDSLRPEKKGKKGEKAKRAKKGKRPRVDWVGFQQKRFYSRVFIQMDRLSRFTLHKPNDKQIVVQIEGAGIPKRNTLRPVLTGEFSSSVASIRAIRKRGGAEVIITLRKPVGYLYKSHGNYIFIDVER